MKSKARIVLCIVFFLLCEHALKGQAIGEPKFPSPNAASLGKYADIPVSYHTGVPNISIPIYTIEEGTLSLPITLSYHGSGIRVDEVASWVGLGWSLNTGGMITRMVHGGPDEGIKGSMQGAASPFVRWGWYKDMGVLQEVYDCSSRPLSTEGPEAGTYPAYGGCAAIYWEAGMGYIDCEPDLFTFNFAGYSGKFFFDQNRNVRMIPESDLFIEPVNSPSYFYSWKIIAPDGTKYFFGGTEAKEISYSDPAEIGGGSKQVSASTTWYLYRMESANGEAWIDFEYQEDSYSFGNRSGHSVIFREFDYSPEGGECCAKQAGEVISNNIYESDGVLNVSIVDARRISKITTSSGYVTVNFIPSQNAREDLTRYDKSIPTYSTELSNTISKRLQYIEIITARTCRRFELSHDYYSSAECTGCTGRSWYGDDFDKKRLRLNSVQESVCDGEILPKYEFYYDPEQLPRRYSLAKDMWGYYNGIEGNTGLLETFTNPVLMDVTYTTANYRTVVESKLKAGTLIKIKYPTGGWSEFSYEAHRESDTSPIIGGLRLKTLTSEDASGQRTVKTFQYLIGTLYLNPSNYKNHYPNNNDNWTGAFLGGFDFGISHSSNPMPAMYSSQGYHIGYSKVKVIEPGNGYSIYTYLNSSPALINPAQYPFKATVATLGTSELSSESTHVNENIDENVFISKSTMSRGVTGTYFTANPRRVSTVTCINCDPNFRTNYGIYMDYYISTNRFNLTQKVESRDGVTTTTTYTYDSAHNNVKSSQSTSSEGHAQRSEWIYPGDAGSGAPPIMYDKTRGDFKNMTGVVVEESSFLNGNLTFKVNNKFTQSGTNIFVTSSKKFPSGSSDFLETKYEYDKDAKIVNVKQTDGSNITYLWSYNKKYPIAEVKNADLGPMSTDYSTSNYVGKEITENTLQDVALSPDFELFSNQTVTPSLTVSMMGTNGPPSPYLTAILKRSDGTAVKTHNCSWGSNTVGDIALTPGVYQWYYNAIVDANVDFEGYDLDITTPYTGGRTGYQSFHTSFEEDGVSNSEAKTGAKVWAGVYEINLPGYNGDYKLSYWQKAGSNPWALFEQIVTVTEGIVKPMNIGASGSIIDEVRLMPRPALMTTYTYDPGIGVASSTDSNQVAVYYEYDDFGRLKLIKDNEKNVLKIYTYHYKK